MRWIAFTTLIVTSFGIPVPALAQDAGRPWVAARVLWDVDLTWTDNDPSGVAGGFSLGLWSYLDKTDAEKRNSYRPRIAIKHIDSKRALKGFTGRQTPDGSSRDLRASVQGP